MLQFKASRSSSLARRGARVASFWSGLSSECYALNCPTSPSFLNPVAPYDALRRIHADLGRFIKLAGGEKRICEYNQEACRLEAFDGKKSLVRSFPSKVGVRFAATRTRWCGGALGVGVGCLGLTGLHREREKTQECATTTTTKTAMAKRLVRSSGCIAGVFDGRGGVADHHLGPESLGL